MKDFPSHCAKRAATFMVSDRERIYSVDLELSMSSKNKGLSAVPGDLLTA